MNGAADDFYRGLLAWQPESPSIRFVQLTGVTMCNVSGGRRLPPQYAVEHWHKGRLMHRFPFSGSISPKGAQALAQRSLRNYVNCQNAELVLRQRLKDAPDLIVVTCASSRLAQWSCDDEMQCGSL